MDHNAQYELFEALYERYPGIVIVGCKEDYAWQWQNAHDFALISVTPSLNAEKAGHWHGHITAGEIK